MWSQVFCASPKYRLPNETPYEELRDARKIKRTSTGAKTFEARARIQKVRETSPRLNPTSKRVGHKSGEEEL